MATKGPTSPALATPAKRASTATVGRARPTTAPVRVAASSSRGSPPEIRCTSETIQDGPGLYLQNNTLVAAIKVDSGHVNGRKIKLEGWSVGDCAFHLEADGIELPQQIVRKKRPDVSESLEVPEPADGFGFTLTARIARGKSGPFTFVDSVRANGSSKVFRHLLKLESLGIAGEGASRVHALGYIEAASTSFLTGDSVVVGWGLNGPGVQMWLEADDGETYPLADAFSLPRQDVRAAHGPSFGPTNREAGFIARLDGMMPGESVKLMAKDENGIETKLGATISGNLDATPADAARWLFGLGTPLTQFHERVSLIDAPVIERLIRYTQQSWQSLPVEVHELGKLPEKPMVSIIVPLFGRTDFVENQFLEFVRDPWCAQHVELIYVVDDPAIIEPFRSQAEAMHRLFGLPFRWVWGAVNRGFSAANNLGVDHSRGDYILFMNSDVFPQSPGWLPQLLQVLEKNPTIGAVAPRLVFADGSIQHAAMEFVRREELGVWINHHPYMGLDPSLDPHKELTLVPAVTGACMLVRRFDLDRVGGWDTGYLIGDFEDSDLCLKFRSVGLSIAYLPDVQLTHLERQSFKLLGHADFRSRVVIYNAVRHQTRWKDLLEGIAATSGSATQ